MNVTSHFIWAELLLIGFEDIMCIFYAWRCSFLKADLTRDPYLT